MSGGHSKSSSKAQSFVDPSQAPFLGALRQQGLQTLQGQGQFDQDFFTQLAGGLQSQGAQGLQGLGDIIGGNNPFMQQLAQRSQAGNPELDALIQQTQGDIGRNFQEQILPAIGGAAAGLGQRGGSRQGVAEGIAARDAQRLASEASTNLRFQDFGQQTAAAQAALANQQGAIGQLFPALGAQFGLGTAPVTAPFLGLQQLAGILGPANILNTSKSSSFSMHGGVG
jgi:hypothetical protein